MVEITVFTPGGLLTSCTSMRTAQNPTNPRFSVPGLIRRIHVVAQDQATITSLRTGDFELTSVIYKTALCARNPSIYELSYHDVSTEIFTTGRLQSSTALLDALPFAVPASLRTSKHTTKPPPLPQPPQERYTYNSNIPQNTKSFSKTKDVYPPLNCRLP